MILSVSVSMIMCGNGRDDDGRLVGPTERGKAATGGIYVVVSDPEGHVWNFGSHDPWHTRAFEGVGA